MRLTDLTDPQAVLSAIQEFDLLGREEFLAKHGFGPARSYFLRYEGRRYDSKAIAGVALGFQYPEDGPLAADEFSGGRETVGRVLKSLGFNVIHEQERDRAPRCWAFCANPNRYRIRDALRHRDLENWSVPKGDVQEGDKVLIWQTRDRQGRRGVVAVGEVTSDPIETTDSKNPYWVDAADGERMERRVPVRYLPASGLPRWTDDPDAGRFLEGLSVARARGGTVFKVTRDQWAKLQAFVAAEAPSPEALEAEEAVRYRTRGRRGQGFGLSAEERLAVEQYAMDRATEYLEDRWDSVDDVSRNSSFDIHCRNASEERRVEVKGTTSSGEEIILTRNEVREAQQAGYALFLVSVIELGRDETGTVVASGGECRYFDPWAADEAQLKPISFKCTVALSAAQVVG